MSAAGPGLIEGEGATGHAEIRFWDAETGKLIRRWDAPLGFGAHRLAFAPDGSRLAGAGFDGVVHLWDPAVGTPISSLTGHKGFIYGLSFSPDGRQLASGAWDRTVKLYVDAAESSPPSRPNNMWTWRSPGRPEPASCGMDSTVKTWTRSVHGTLCRARWCVVAPRQSGL